MKTVVLTPAEVDAWWELSPRQRVIADLLRTNFTNKAIGRALSITADTVNDHLCCIRRHLNVGSRVQIALYAERMAHRMNSPGAADRYIAPAQDTAWNRGSPFRLG